MKSVHSHGRAVSHRQWHWPTDVLAGWCLGSAWALGWWLVAVRLQRRGRVEKRIDG
jgi:membrane-associated phospholipid phosphatase